VYNIIHQTKTILEVKGKINFMNTEKAFEILKLNGWNLYKNGKTYFVVSHGGNHPDEEICPRELIKKASYYTSENSSRNYKKSAKKYRHKNNRQSTREDIHHENFDNFSHNELRDDEDIWNWD
jgi:creatinine amidohydrolase/Fe(II)-dependent formamide hydrolase-like protein